MLIVGDVHGKVDKFWEVTQKHKDDVIIQLGDFGFHDHHQWFLNNMDTEKHKIVFGNHDYYPALHEPHSLGDFGEFDICFAVRGASSIDRYQRTEGIDWFANEELTYGESYAVLEAWEKSDMPIMVTHECPQMVFDEMRGTKMEKSFTRTLLQELYEIKQPEIWFFGHHHRSFQKVIGNTNFICLAELETFEL